MISARCTEIPTGRIRIVFSIPSYAKNIVIEEECAVNAADAKRRLYFRLRRYITETLKAWLMQRWYAIASNKTTDRYTEKLNAIQILINQLNTYQQASHRRVVDLVCRQRSKIELISPGEKSRYRDHYIKIILPILKYCREMNGETE